MNYDRLKQDLDQVIETCRTKEKWDNNDRKTLQKVRKALGPPAKVANALGVSVPTLYWWERQIDLKKQPDQLLQPPPPEQQLIKLYSMLPGEPTPEPLPSNGQTGPKAPPGISKIRSASEIIERSAYCDRTWIMRSGRPFVVLHDPKMFDLMLEFLRKGRSHAHFVFRSPKKGEDVEGRFSQAKITFEALWKRLCEKVARPNLKWIHKVPISDQNEANALGLVDPWNSFCMFEYSEEGRAQFGKSVDVWQEVIVDDSSDPQIQNKRPVWLELPADEAEKWRESRIKLLLKNKEF